MTSLEASRLGVLICGLMLAGACGQEPTDEGAAPQPQDDGGGPDGGQGCPASLAGRFALTPVVDTKATQQVFAAVLPAQEGAQGVLLAWAAQDGVHLTRTDAAFARVGKDVVVAGTAVYGLAAREGAYAALVSRGSDALYLVLVAQDGAVLRQQRLLGEVDHKVVNNEWFGTGIRAGRLIWTGAQWAAYFTVQRLWPDNVAHYGDTLRLHGADGAPASTVWGWGCSHSMEVGLAQRPGQLGAICASDCYPQKGVLFNHRTFLYGDSVANCAGKYGTHLGGLVALQDGFWAAFTAGEKRESADVALARIGADGKPGAPVWLSSDKVEDSAPRLARYGAELLVGYRAAGQTGSGAGKDLFTRADLASGTAAGAGEALPGSDLGAASDFLSFANGDVGWAQRSAAGISVARVRACK